MTQNDRIKLRPAFLPKVWQEGVFLCEKQLFTQKGTTVSAYARNHLHKKDGNMKSVDCGKDVKLNSIAIVTSTPEEYETMKRVLNQNGTGERTVIVLCTEGKCSTTSVYNDILLKYPGIRSVISCGTAEGVACEIGDVVISKGLLQYDREHEKERLVKIRCSDELANAVIQTIQDEYTGNSEWRTELKGYPKLHYADVVTAELIANSKGGSSPWMGRYNVKAIEPEASGIFGATEENEVPFLVICGISGIAGGDGIKGQIMQGLEWGRNKISEIEKNHAMLNAAMYVKRVVACAGGM